MCKREKGLYAPWMLVTDVVYTLPRYCNQTLSDCHMQMLGAYESLSDQKCHEILFW